MLEDCARSDPWDANAAFVLGRSYLLDRDENRAVSWLERASQADAGNSLYQLWLGRAYGAQAIQASLVHQASLARRVRQAFERAVELDPNNLAARLSLVEYDLRAPAFLGGSSQKARAQAEEIRRRDSLRGHRAFGRIAEHEKRFEAAAEEYGRAIKESPEASDPVYWRAELAERRKDYATAFDLFETLARSGSSPEALYEIGRLAGISGQQLALGEESLKLYLERQPGLEEPSLAWAHCRLGSIYERKKDRVLARREYTAALEVDPLLTEARQALAKLR